MFRRRVESFYFKETSLLLFASQNLIYICFKFLGLSYFFPCYSISSNLQPSVFLYSKASGVSGVVVNLDIYIRLSIYLRDGGGGCSSSCAFVLFSSPYTFSMQYRQQPRKMMNLLLCCLSSGANEQKAGIKCKTKPLIPRRTILHIVS